MGKIIHTYKGEQILSHTGKKLKQSEVVGKYNDLMKRKPKPADKKKTVNDDFLSLDPGKKLKAALDDLGYTPEQRGLVNKLFDKTKSHWKEIKPLNRPDTEIYVANLKIDG